MTKNKTCPPNRRGGFYTINYAMGIDYLRDLTDVAMKYNIVQQSGSWFAVANPETGEILVDKIHGIAQMYDYLKAEENESTLSFIEEYIDSKIC
jgi:hypothetical protein